MPAAMRAEVSAELPAGVRRFAVDALQAEPWRNGAGLTRTVWPHAVDGRDLWRVSVADLPEPAAFSCFPGWVRRSVLLRGPGLVLGAQGASWSFPQVGSVAAYPGELPILAQPPQGGSRLLNVMADRARVTPLLQVDDGPASGLRLPLPSILMVLSGEADIGPAGAAWGTFGAEQGLVLEAGLPGPLSIESRARPLVWALISFQMS
ncbi:MAG: hypothetical protein RLY78_1275 [Pseudomonadota bacterium]|jgi:environmental stress-induced protein Ves